jgi:flagellar motor switch/type III secretory pathway protein FliN
MIRHRTKKQVNLFDLFKLVVTIILIILLIYFWRTGTGGPSVAATEPAATEQTGGEEAAPAETEAEAAPDETETTEVTLPTLNLPAGEFEPGEVELTGTGEPGSEVEIVVDGDVIGTTTVGSDGAWSLLADLPEAGDYQLGVRSLGPDGSVLAEVEPVSLSLRAPSIAMPTLNLPAGELGAGEVELTGTGEPGSEVEIVVDGDVIGTTTVGSDGAWSFLADLPEAGDYRLGLRSLGSDGTVLGEVEPVSLRLSAPSMTIPTLSLPTGELGTGEVELTGAGEPGSEVEIVVNGDVIGTTTVGSDGTWSFLANLPEVGDYRLSLRSVTADGQVLAESEASTVAVTGPMADTASEAAPEVSPSSTQAEGQAYIVQADDWLSKLADKFYGDMFAYPAIVEATNAKATQDDSFIVIDNPDLIEIGQQLWIPDKSTVIPQ